VSEDVSLDEFGGSQAAERSEDADPSKESRPSDESGPSGEADPAVSTYEWSPEGGECAACGRTAERRWRSDGEREGALVCPDCKEW
jgi:hypothetical protein